MPHRRYTILGRCQAMSFDTTREVHLADVAASRRLLEPRDTAILGGPVRLGSFDAQTAVLYLQNPGAPPFYLTEITNAVLLMPTAVIVKDGLRIPETRYLINEADYAA